MTAAFEDWMASRGNVGRIFKLRHDVEIVGRSAAVGHFASAKGSPTTSEQERRTPA